MSFDKFLKKPAEKRSFFAAKPASSVPGLPNYVPFHKVTHRAIGDVPGCLPAYDYFTHVSLEEMRVETGKRADEICRLINEWKDGTGPGKDGFATFRNHPFHSTDVKLSPLKNPSPKYQRIWDVEQQARRSMKKTNI